jgi:predicted aminopeptidase
VTKKVILTILALLLVCCVWQRDLLGYAASQAKGQLSIVMNAQPIEKCLADSTLPDSLRNGLQLVQDVRRFAFDSLGIPKSDNYTTFYDQHGQPVLWVITASKPYELKAKEWCFPLLGCFSYKGFFNKEAALAEEEALKADGYEVLVEVVNGWSTLGWFKDPVLSNMLKRSEGGLASLIVHELTHGVLYVKDSVTFNENLATFVGEQAALQFMATKYGRDTYEYQQYANNKSDYDKYCSHILNGATKLDSLYASFNEQQADSTKSRLKKECIGNIFARLDTVSFIFPELYLNHFSPDNYPSNTYFMSYRRYRSQQNMFDKQFRGEYKGDFKKYLAYLKKAYPRSL